jgi:hypothetical protein
MRLITPLASVLVVTIAVESYPTTATEIPVHPDGVFAPAWFTSSASYAVDTITGEVVRFSLENPRPDANQI